LNSDPKQDDVVVADRETVEKVAPFVQPNAQEGELEITEAYVADDGEVLDRQALEKSIIRSSMRNFDRGRVHSEENNEPLVDVAKAVEGSTQQKRGSKEAFTDLSTTKVVEPPYNADVLAMFLEVDETHYRCVKAKTTDSVGRDYEVKPTTMPSGDVFDPATADDAVKKKIDEEVVEVRTFIEECNDVVGFDGVTERAAMDFESIGYAGIEVIRSRDGKIARIAHIPAARLRVMRGWKGFVEIVGPQKFVYYQPFGEKVISTKRKDPVTHKPEPYNPRLDGELKIGGSVGWSMIDRETGKRTTSLTKAANEILWVPKHHPNSVYYGVPDVIPAVGHVFANVYIRDYLLQFFEHNTVPQYAVIVEGARLAKPVKETITKFFSEHVKGQNHKTLIIPVPSMGGEVKIRFEKLAADSREGSFQDTRKNGATGIMVAHGVSPAIIGVTDAAALGSGKGLSQAEIYKDRIVTPSQRRWERVLNKMFRLGLGVVYVNLKYDPLDIRDLHQEMMTHVGYQKGGSMTINEVRKAANLGDPIEGGDRAFIPGPQMPIFVDELTEAAGAQFEALQGEIEALNGELQTRAAAQAAAPKPPPKKVPNE